MSTPYERLAVLTALGKILTTATAEAKSDVLALMDEGDRKTVKAGDDELAAITHTRGRVTVEVTSMRDLIEWCRENVPDAVTTLRSLTPGAQIRAEAAYLATAAAHEVVTRDVVDGERLAQFKADVKAGAVIPGIDRVKADGYLTVKQSDEQRETVARLAREGRVTYELEG